MIVLCEDMKCVKFDIGYRDFCVYFFILLNECRCKFFYFLWKCGYE